MHVHRSPKQLGIRLSSFPDPQQAEARTIAFLSTYPPRACGIATFTRDLSEAISQSQQNLGTAIMAITEKDMLDASVYPAKVRWTIDQHDPHSWQRAAEQLNSAPIDLVCIQHEFGLYGRFDLDGHFTDYLAGFLERIAKPVISTLHTVLPQPTPDLRHAIRLLHTRSAAVVTMVNQARQILTQDYGLNASTLHTIPHGVPEAPWVPPEQAKKVLGLDGHTVLSTFGLLSQGKGIEYAIRALPEVLRRHPDVLYLVLGATHPEVRCAEGERYRQILLDLVEGLRLGQSVRFVNRYLTQQEVVRYLQATDIYLTPYCHPNQITSGTLAYALGCGKVAVSTPYLYAVEALSEGRGLLAGFANPASFARCINLLLGSPALRAKCEAASRVYGLRMGWSDVGAQYAKLFSQVTAWTCSPKLSDPFGPSERQVMPMQTQPAMVE